MAHYLFFGSVYDSVTDPRTSQFYGDYNRDTYEIFGYGAIDAAYELKDKIKSSIGIY